MVAEAELQREGGSAKQGDLRASSGQVLSMAPVEAFLSVRRKLQSTQDAEELHGA